jgi:hypothetical protein
VKRYHRLTRKVKRFSQYQPWSNRLKLLAIEREVPGIPSDAFQPYLRAEAAHAWQLYQAGVIRELYFRQDEHSAVLVLECADVQEAWRHLQSLPLVQAGLITFEVIPLVAYPGFARLFGETPDMLT